MSEPNPDVAAAVEQPSRLAALLRYSPVLPGVLLIAITMIAYLPALGGGFVYDDRMYVTEDARMDSAGGLGRIWSEVSGPEYRHQYYPLTTSVFWIQHQLWGEWSFGYHLFNILLHAANAVLLWRLLAGLRVPGAWLAGALFALHPVHVESVAWIAELKNVLSTYFFLSAAHVFVRYFGLDELAAFRESPSGPRTYAVGLALFVAALLSKTATALLPAALLLILWWKRGRLTRRDLVALAPLAVIGAGFVLVTMGLETHHRALGEAFDQSWLERVLIAGRALWFYAGKLVWPTELTLIYPRWAIDAAAWTQYLYPLAVVAVMAVLWVGRRRLGNGPFAAVAFFVVAAAPISFGNVAFSQFSFVADHWQYWSSMGLIALAAAVAAGPALAWAKHPAARWPAGAVAALLLVAMGSLTWQRAHAWENGIVLWEDTVRKNPGSTTARYNLGVALQQAGRLEEAIEAYRAALDIDPDDPLVLNNLGIALRLQGRLNEAIEQYRAALRVAPNFARAHTNLGEALQQQGRVEEAMEAYRESIHIQPDFAGAHYNLGVALRSQGRVREAMKHYRAAIAHDPKSAEAHLNLGEALQSIDRLDEAIRHYWLALEIKPDFAAARINLALALQADYRVDGEDAGPRGPIPAPMGPGGERPGPDWPMEPRSAPWGTAVGPGGGDP